MKTKDVISWDDWFMGIALLSSQRSKCKSKSGACIVNPEKIIAGIGYTGLPSGFDDRKLLKKNVDNSCRNEDLVYGIINAILNTKHDLKGCSIYVNSFPFHESAKMIVQSGIKKVYYLNDFDKTNESMIASKRMFEAKNIELIHFIPNQESILIDFEMYKTNEDQKISLFSRLKNWFFSLKKKIYLSWDEYFMGIAILATHRSKDPSTKVGSCIVTPNKRITGVGYNGFPRVSEGTNDTIFSWEKSDIFLENRNTYVVHSEANAILNSKYSLVGCTIYVGLFPCNECVKLIIQSGIKRVIYLSDRNKHNAYFKKGKRMLKKAGIKTKKFRTTRRQIVINFNVWNRKSKKLYCTILQYTIDYHWSKEQ